MGVSQFSLDQNLLCDIKQSQHICSLDAKGDEGNSHHQQVQEVEVIPTERSFMEEGSVCGHLRCGGGETGNLQEELTKTHKKTHILSCTDMHTHAPAHPHRYISHSTFQSTHPLKTLK